MKRFSPILQILLVILLFGMIGCTHVREEAPKFTLSATSLELTVGEETTLTVLAEPADTPFTAHFSASDSSVVSVSDAGLVRALREGSANIVVAVGSLSLFCEVRVTENFVPAYTLTPAEATLEEGQTLQLALTSNGPMPAVSYASADPTVAEVSAQGLVFAVHAGQTVITATADGKELTCAVTVTAPRREPQYAFALSAEYAELETAEGYPLALLIDPAPAADRAFAIVWTATGSVGCEPASDLRSATVFPVDVGEGSVTVTIDGVHTLVCRFFVKETAIF